MSVLHNNPFLIASGNPTDPTFPLQRSVRLRSSASAYFNRTPAVVPTNYTKTTISFWVKNLNKPSGEYSTIYGQGDYDLGTPANRNGSGIYFVNDRLYITEYASGTTRLLRESNALFRDPAAWYHFVISIDTTLPNANDRCVVWCNGVQLTWLSATNPTQNINLYFQSTLVSYIGTTSFANPSSKGRFLDGYLTEVNFIDGQALTPLSFGGYNPGTNVWEPRAYIGTYGTNGFYLPFKLDTTTSYAGSFNGTAKYISAPNNALFAQQSATSWTAEGWVYSASATLQQLFYYGNSTVSTGNDIAFGLAYTPGSTFTLFQYNGTTNTPITSTLNVPLGQWCHIAAVNNGGTITLYLNGVPCGSGSAVTTNSTGTMLFYVGNYSSSRYINGQVSNFRLVKGTAVYTSKFTPTTSPLTAITNTVLLTLQDSTIIDNSTNAFTLTNTGSLTTVSATPYVANMSSDASGNNNGWIPNNINASTAGVTYDSMLDVPTLTSATNANFAVMNPLFGTVGTLSNANLSITSSGAGNTQRLSTMAVSSGKWYYEVTFSSLPTNTDPLAGFTEINNTSAVTQYPGQAANSYSIYTFTGNTFIQKVNNSTFTNTNTTIVAQGNIIGVALDLDNNKIWFAKNNVWVDSGDPAAGTNSQFTVSAGTYAPCIRSSGSGGTATLDVNFGQRPFSYTPPTGFKSLNTYNLPEPTIPRGEQYFKQYLYTGNGGGLQVGEIQKPSSLFNLDRSLRLRSSNSAYLSKTPASAGNRKTWTWAGWVKRGTFASYQYLLDAYVSANVESSIRFTNTDTLQVYQFNASAVYNVITTQTFRDPAAWNHIVVAFDTTQASSSDRVKVYINGIQVTVFGTASYPSLNFDSYINNTYLHSLGRASNSGGVYYLDGYMADTYFIDGQALAPTQFGQFDGNNYWTPKAYTGTYGTNGFHLEFEDYSAATASAIGKDTSGNNNNWTPSGINLTTPEVDNEYWDSYTDVPTLNDANTANYCVFDSLQFGSTELRNGNLTYVWGAASTAYKYKGTTTLTTGKWYFEGNIEAFTIGNAGNTNYAFGFIADSGIDTHVSFGWTTNGTSMKLGYRYDLAGVIVQNVTYNTTAPISTDIFGVEYDVDNGTANFYKNGTLMGSASGLALGAVKPQVWRTGTSNSATVHANFGQRAFKYTPSTGYKKINAFNIAEVVGDVETPDLVRIKSRSATTPAMWFNSISGVGKYILGNNNTSAEATDVNSLIQFNKNGLLIGNNANVNTLSATYIADVWKAGDSTVTNTDGTITSQVRANRISGVSVVTYTNSTGTVGHGLNAVPAMIIYKGRGPTAANWTVMHKSLVNMTSYYLNLNTTGASTTLATAVAAPTLTTFGTNGTAIPNAESSVAFVFAEIDGFSKFGSYVSNGSSTDGPFVYTGFRPRWVMIKQRDATRSWIMYDTTRNTFNVVDKYFFMEGLNNNEQTAALLDINSNGFKLKNNNVNTNTTAGQVYIYVAFAEHPFKYALAR